MAVRSSMASLIARIRVMINDPSGVTQVFSDQDVQNVLDETRQDMRYLSLAPAPTYSGSSLLYLDYYSDLGNFEDDITFWQYRTSSVTPSVSENIAGHWTFATTTLPPVYAIGKTYDIFRAAADLLERRAAQWMMSYSVGVDGQSLQRSQVLTMILDLAHTMRLKQRPISISTTRSDLVNRGGGPSLAPNVLDYQGSGDGR